MLTFKTDGTKLLQAYFLCGSSENDILNTAGGVYQECKYFL